MPNIKNPTSFKKILHTDYDLQTLLADICKAVEARYLQLKSGKINEITAGYMQKLYLMDEWAIFKINGDLYSGKICGVSVEGYLQVEIKKEIQQFNFKEIEFINITQ
jgi:BirA family biotin operon repressor/biotin-[acetyl-CoA-carboxylase] ligase